MELTSSAGQDTRVDMLVISLICNNLYIVCILVICISYGRYCRHCLICRLLLYNNFKRGVMSRVNVYLTFRMLLYFRISNSVMLSGDNGNIMDYWIFIPRYCFEYVFFNVIRYNSNGIL